MPLQQTVVPQGHGIESRSRFGGTPAAERQGVGRTRWLCDGGAKVLLTHILNPCSRRSGVG